MSEATGGGKPGEAGVPSKAQLGKGLVQAGWGGRGPCRHHPPQAQQGRYLVQGGGGRRQTWLLGLDFQRPSCAGGIAKVVSRGNCLLV